jgi:hypothetical protein
MSRKAGPLWLRRTRRTVATRLLIEERRSSSDDAEAWLVEWDAEAARLGLKMNGDYWTLGSVWILEQRRARRTPAA